jgi:hypothetical protein
LGGPALDTSETHCGATEIHLRATETRFGATETGPGANEIHMFTRGSIKKLGLV